jgi:integrase
MQSHTLFGGKVNIYKRENSSYWQCSTYLQGRNHRISTKEDSLQHAKEIAEDWYLELRGKSRAGTLKYEKTFAEVAAHFLEEYEVITEGQRSKRWTQGHAIRLRIHLLPFLGDLPISDITAGKVQEYRVHRMRTTGKPNPNAKDNRPPKMTPPSRNTIHNEIITLRQVLKTAVRHGWLAALPDLSLPYKTQGKIVHRPWFSPVEYKQLYTATREYTREALPHVLWSAEQVHDFVLFMANTGLRPDEARNLQHRDVEIVLDQSTDETILEIEVRGKRGVGYCKSTPGAVLPYERMLKRPKPSRYLEEADKEKILYPQPTDPVFPGNHIKLFNNLLERNNLKFDREGNARTAYSLRHTYICLRLMEGADIYQIAKNCRTSVEMIEKYYAAHIKNTLDAAAINVRRSQRTKTIEKTYLSEEE